MSKILSLVKSKKGAALMSAIAFMTIAVALCGMITTFILAMANTSSSYTSVNENKIVADNIAADFMSYCKQTSVSSSFTDSYSKYSDYALVYYYSADYKSTTAEAPGGSAGYNYYCYAYESNSSSTALIYIEIDSSNKYTRYEYGNI